MSNLWLNIRFYIWHLQAGDPKWYSFRICRNDYHLKNWKIFKVYEIRQPRSSNCSTGSPR